MQSTRIKADKETMTETATLHTLLRSHILFEACSDDFIARLAEKAHLQKAGKSQILFLHQDEAEKFFIVRSGWIKLFRETLDGTQAVVDILPAGHMFGETSLFENERYPYSAEAAEPSEVIALPLALLKDEIESNPKLAMAMLSSMARYRKQQDQELEHRTLQNAPQRIGCFLLRLVDQNTQGPITIHLPYDKTLVASRLGMQPETFSRALAKLKGATGIEIKGASVQVQSLQQLSDYSCAACTSEFPCKDVAVESA